MTSTRTTPGPPPVLPDPPTAYCSLEQVAARLRVDLDTLTPADADWLTLCWQTACQQIDVYYLDRPLLGPAWPAGVTYAAVGMSCLAYRGKDAMSDLTEEWSEQQTLRVPRRTIDAYEAWLAPFRYGGSWSPR